MKGFVLGLLVAGIGFAGYFYLKGYLHLPSRPVADVDAGEPVKEVKEKKKKRRRGAGRVAPTESTGEPAGPGGQAAPPVEAEPEPVKLSSADLKLVSQGDDLSKPDVIHMGDATDDSGSHELSQDDIDAKFHAK